MRSNRTTMRMAPPVDKEADPENVERRFGFGEAKARRDAEQNRNKKASSAGKGKQPPTVVKPDPGDRAPAQGGP